jgi:hypothetical protein
LRLPVISNGIGEPAKWSAVFRDRSLEDVLWVFAMPLAAVRGVFSTFFVLVRFAGVSNCGVRTDPQLQPDLVMSIELLWR